MAEIGLNIGLSGLLNAQRALDVLGNNLANANTPGYTRQRLLSNPASSTMQGNLRVGNGVQGQNVVRVHDDVLSRRITSQVSLVSRLEESLQALRGVEGLLSPGGLGIDDLLSGFFESVASLSAEPGDLVRRNGVVQSAEQLTSQFHQSADSAAGLMQDTRQRIETLVDEANGLAGQIRDLNQEIAQIESGGTPANDLRDRRAVAMEQLSSLVDVRYQQGAHGTVTVTLDGNLVAGQQLVHELRVEDADDGGFEIYAGGATRPLEVRGGRVGGLVRFAEEQLPQVQQQLDDLAYHMALEVNRAHSTGAPPEGGFQRLTGWVELSAADGDPRGVPLRNLETPFPIGDGELYVHVTDDATGEVETTRLELDAAGSTLGDLLDRLSAIEGLNASLDSTGRVQVRADGGKRFDFTSRLDAHPDSAGTMGGARATVSSAFSGPFDLASGSDLQLQGGAGPFSVTFDAADFADISRATAEEVAAVLNADPNVAASGLRVQAAQGRLVIQSDNTGASESFDVLGGTALAALGIDAGTVTGQDVAVQVEVSGSYTGSENRTLEVRALGNGQVGTSAGLRVEVRTAEGEVLGVFDVGEGYVPGSELSIGDGLSFSLTVGELSATDHDHFITHAIADSDTSDVLVGLGLNAFYTGTDASTIAVDRELANDPGRLAASATGSAGDNGALLELLALQSSVSEGLGSTLGEAFGNLVGDVGFEVSAAASAAETETFMLESLEARRQEVTGVNVDEELVNMIQFEQAFQAAARYIQVVQQIGDTILQLV